MPTIRIDDEVWSALQSQARPFVDTPNDVLRKVLGLNRSSDAGGTVTIGGTASLKPGPKQQLNRTAESEFRLPILEALADMGGRGAVRDLLQRVQRRMKDRLKADDLGTLAVSGETRWENTAKWARKRMVEQGLLSANSPHGIWEITEAGRRYIERTVAGAQR